MLFKARIIHLTPPCPVMASSALSDASVLFSVIKICNQACSSKLQ